MMVVIKKWNGTMAEAMREGEEFRDDRRRNRPLPPEVVRELTRLDGLKDFGWRG